MQFLRKGSTSSLHSEDGRRQLGSAGGRIAPSQACPSFMNLASFRAASPVQALGPGELNFSRRTQNPCSKQQTICFRKGTSGSLGRAISVHCSSFGNNPGLALSPAGPAHHLPVGLLPSSPSCSPPGHSKATPQCHFEPLGSLLAIKYYFISSR